MKSVFWKRTTVLVICTFGVWFGVKFLLPVALPFLLGGLLAVASEPAIRWGTDRLKLPRFVASVLGIGLSILILSGILFTLGGIVFQRIGAATQNMPDLDGALQTAENTLLTLAEKAPSMLRTLAQRTVRETFHDGSAVLNQLTRALPGAVSSFLSKFAGSALSIGTGILAAFFISVRLPKLRRFAEEILPPAWQEKYLPVLKRVKDSVVGWVKAQGKLALVTWGIVTLGLFLLGVKRAPLWAFLIALVDAVPVLGTGIVLLPWAGISFLQGQTLRAVGLLAVYGAAALTRILLEPRVVGRNLGLDPLLTLVAMYAGFRFWGVGGMLLTPILVSAAKNVIIEGK